LPSSASWAVSSSRGLHIAGSRFPRYISANISIHESVSERPSVCGHLPLVGQALLDVRPDPRRSAGSTLADSTAVRNGVGEPAFTAPLRRRSVLWLSSQRKVAGMDGNRTHPGRLSSAPQTVLKTAGL
jgi:hypothetical protein